MQEKLTQKDDTNTFNYPVLKAIHRLRYSDPRAVLVVTEKEPVTIKSLVKKLRKQYSNSTPLVIISKAKKNDHYSLGLQKADQIKWLELSSFEITEYLQLLKFIKPHAIDLDGILNPELDLLVKKLSGGDGAKRRKAPMKPPAKRSVMPPGNQARSSGAETRPFSRSEDSNNRNGNDNGNGAKSLKPTGPKTIKLAPRAGSSKSVKSIKPLSDGKSTTEPVLTVCLPLILNERILPRYLETISKLSKQPFEILAPGGDEQKRLVENLSGQELALQRKLCTWVCPGVKTRGELLNECLKRARGKYLLIPGSDFPASADKVESLFARLDRGNEAAFLLGSQHFFDSKLDDSSNDLKSNSSETTFSNKELIDMFIERPHKAMLNDSTIAFSADLIGKGFNRKLSHLSTVEYLLRLTKKSSLVYIPSASNTDSESSGSFAYAYNRDFFINLISEVQEIGKAWTEKKDKLPLDGYVLFDRVIKSMAEVVTIIEEQGGFAHDFRQSSLRSGASNRENISRLNNELVTVRKLLFESLGTLSRSSYAPGSGSANASKERISRLENRLRELLESPSWRYTKVLRDTNKLLNDRSTVEDYIPESLSHIKSIECNRNYEKYLKDTIKRVKTSRSWRVASTIRLMIDPIDIKR